MAVDRVGARWRACRGASIRPERDRARLLVLLAAALPVAVLLWGELVHRRSSRRRVGPVPAAGGREAVVVLGYRNRGSRANRINRYRVRAGLRSLDPDAIESVLVLCGGAAADGAAEADLMARFARDELGYRGPLVIEAESRSTWQNIENAIPLVEHADTIKIVSNSLHAEKGRVYLERLRPDLAARLAPAEEYRFGELTLVKPVAAVIGLRNLRGLAR